MRQNNYSVRKLTFLALTAAAAIVGRTLFISIPNVQPVTDIVLVMTLYLGLWEGFSVAMVTIMITNLYMGMGIWTVFQIITYGVIVLITWLFRRLLKKAFILQIVHSVLAGILYGFIISLLQAVSFMGMNRFLPYYAAGIYFDLLHGIGNGILYIIFVPVFIKLIRKYDMEK